MKTERAGEIKIKVTADTSEAIKQMDKLADALLRHPPCFVRLAVRANNKRRYRKLFFRATPNRFKLSDL